MERIVLGIVDYIIFAAMLIISAGIGIFFRFSGSKQKTTEEYLLAGKDMSILPVAFSLMASFLSAIAMLGIPAEMYRFGTHMAFKTIGFIIGSVMSSYIFLPVFFEVQAATAYEYLERRFGKIARRLSSFAFILHMMLYMPVVLYGPALALSAVTDLSTWVAVISVGAVCTFYCTLGGMKAVLWTDAFQTLLMFLGIFAVIIKGTGDVGDIDTVLQIANKGGRLVVPGFELGLDVRYTMWNMIGHAILAALSAFGVNQVQVQRLLTVKNVSKARTALFVSIPLWCIFHLLNCFAGIVIYAYFANCDPMTAPNSTLTSSDQLLPYFMMSALSKYPGLAGLCICGIFSASLSTASSAVNSLTAVTMEDFVRPIFERMGMSEKKLAFSAKLITLSYGVVCLALTFVVAKFGNLIQASFTIFGLIGGPLLSMFLLGMMTQRTNEKGIVIGLITAIAFSSWISCGTSTYAPPPKVLPVSVEGCVSTELTNATVFPHMMSSLFDADQDNATSFSFFINNTDTSTTNISSENVFFLYRISYMWIGPIGFTVCTTVGYTLSIIFNVISGSTKDIPEELLSPVLKFFLNKKPESGRKERKKSKPPELEIVNPITIGTQNIKELQEFNSKL